MTFEIVFVLLSLLGMVAALIADKMRPGMILFSVVVLFLCAGILTPKEMLEGFIEYGVNAETFHQIGICFRIEVVSPLQRGVVCCQNGVFVSFKNTIAGQYLFIFT